MSQENNNAAGAAGSMDAFFTRGKANEGVQLPLYLPGAGLSGDNGAMIGGLGYHLFLREGKGDSLALEAETRIPLIKKPCLPYS